MSEPRTASLGSPSATTERWRRNVFAVTAASFMGYTGFTVSMPFLPLYIRELGVTDIGEISVWTGVSLAITPGLTALLAPWWGRLGDRYGRKLMVERSLISFTVMMAALAFVAHPWQVLALRAAQGLFAGYGSLSVAMAAESAPRDRMPNAIGLVQTAQRLGPGVGPVVGGILAGLFPLRRAFLVTAAFYAAALVIVFFMYDDHATHETTPQEAEGGRVTFRNVLAFENFILMAVVIFALQFVDRSYGPILPLYIEQAGVSHARVAIVSGVLFSIMAGTGAIGHHVCGRLLQRFSARRVIAGASAAAAAGSALIGATGDPWLMSAASAIFGIGIGAAMTASYSAAGRVIPAGAHGAGFGLLTSASLTGMASSPFVAGFLGAASLRIVFVANVVMLASVALAVRHKMTDAPGVR
jgi:DHA1 family multidrug resistance protein-like MFS transporter